MPCQVLFGYHILWVCVSEWEGRRVRVAAINKVSPFTQVSESNCSSALFPHLHDFPLLEMQDISSSFNNIKNKVTFH
jgi:hypothetical protein